MEGNGLFSLFVIFLLSREDRAPHCIVYSSCPGARCGGGNRAGYGHRSLRTWPGRPHVVLDTLSSFGLAFLFFLAGYQVDFERVEGRPIACATAGWFLGLLLALSVAAAMGGGRRPGIASVYRGGALHDRVGGPDPYLERPGRARDSIGRVGAGNGSPRRVRPHRPHGGGAGDGTQWVRQRARPKRVPASCSRWRVLLARKVPAAVSWLRIIPGTLHTTGQLAIRLAILLVVAFVFVADLMGLESLLGAFAAGVIVAQTIRTADRRRDGACC